MLKMQFSATRSDWRQSRHAYREAGAYICGRELLTMMKHLSSLREWQQHHGRESGVAKR